MWRTVCAFVLLPSLVLAQSDVTADVPSNQSRSAGTDSKRHAQYFAYVRLRQSSTEKAVVRLFTQEYVTSPRSPVRDIVPLALEFQNASGVKVKYFVYPKAHAEFFAFRPEPIAVVDGKRSLVEFKVRATDTAAFGLHTLAGKFRFQVITDTGVAAPQEVDINFQITVVEYEAEVPNRNWSIMVLGDSSRGAGVLPDQTTASLSSSKGESNERQFIYYSALRQGTTEEAELILALAPDTFVTSPRSPVKGIIPLNLEFPNAAGIRVKDFTYPKTRKRLFAFRQEPIPVANPNAGVEFKIQADDNATMGPYTLSGKLTFQVITENGVSTRQEVLVQCPVTVLKHSSRVHKTNWARTHVSHRERVLTIAFAPLIIAAYIIVCVPGSILGYCRGS
jgi:hypothetical protein